MLTFKFSIVYFIVCVFQIASAFPIFDGVRTANEHASGSFPQIASIISALIVLTMVSLVIGCVCCQQGLLKGRRPILASSPRSFENLDPGSEFTIFPPQGVVLSVPTPASDKITFEPLPILQTHQKSVVPATRYIRPAHFKKVFTQNLSIADWFDEGVPRFGRDKLQYLNEMGEGWFGQVVDAVAFKIKPDEEKTRVVVKILRNEASPSELIYFFHSVQPFKDLKHPNLLQVVSTCLDTQPYLLLLEHAPLDFKAYLLTQQLQDQGENLLKMACDLTSALHYLHSHGFVHSDLASRNCLVFSNLVVKLGDYGLSMEKYKSDYYCMGDQAMPLRWSAPDSISCENVLIEQKEITTEANIWSLGILLWEIFALGQLPYSNLSDEEVLMKVIAEPHLLLEQPNYNFTEMNKTYQIMLMCWKPIDKRISINKLKFLLHYLYDNWQSSSFEHQWNKHHSEIDRQFNLPNKLIQTDYMGFESDFSNLDLDHIPTRDPSTQRQLSDSLQNLSGSLDNLSSDPLSFNEQDMDEIFKPKKQEKLESSFPYTVVVDDRKFEAKMIFDSTASETIEMVKKYSRESEETVKSDKTKTSKFTQEQNQNFNTPLESSKEVKELLKMEKQNSYKLSTTKDVNNRENDDKSTVSPSVFEKSIEIAPEKPKNIQETELKETITIDNKNLKRKSIDLPNLSFDSDASSQGKEFDQDILEDNYFPPEKEQSSRSAHLNVSKQDSLDNFSNEPDILTSTIPEMEVYVTSPISDLNKKFGDSQITDKEEEEECYNLERNSENKVNLNKNDSDVRMLTDSQENLTLESIPEIVIEPAVPEIPIYQEIEEAPIIYSKPSKSSHYKFVFKDSIEEKEADEEQGALPNIIINAPPDIIPIYEEEEIFIPPPVLKVRPIKFVFKEENEDVNVDAIKEVENTFKEVDINKNHSSSQDQIDAKNYNQPIKEVNTTDYKCYDEPIKEVLSIDAEHHGDPVKKVDAEHYGEPVKEVEYHREQVKEVDAEHYGEPVKEVEHHREQVKELDAEHYGEPVKEVEHHREQVKEVDAEHYSEPVKEVDVEHYGEPAKEVHAEHYDEPIKDIDVVDFEHYYGETVKEVDAEHDGEPIEKVDGKESSSSLATDNKSVFDEVSSNSYFEKEITKSSSTVKDFTLPSSMEFKDTLNKSNKYKPSLTSTPLFSSSSDSSNISNSGSHLSSTSNVSYYTISEACEEGEDEDISLITDEIVSFQPSETKRVHNVSLESSANLDTGDLSDPETTTSKNRSLEKILSENTFEHFSGDSSLSRESPRDDSDLGNSPNMCSPLYLKEESKNEISNDFESSLSSLDSSVTMPNKIFLHEKSNFMINIEEPSFTTMPSELPKDSETEASQENKSYYPESYEMTKDFEEKNKDAVNLFLGENGIMDSTEELTATDSISQNDTSPSSLMNRPQNQPTFSDVDDELLCIDTETNEAILLDSADFVVGFVPTQTTEEILNGSEALLKSLEIYPEKAKLSSSEEHLTSIDTSPSLGISEEMSYDNPSSDKDTVDLSEDNKQHTYLGDHSGPCNSSNENLRSLSEDISPNSVSDKNYSSERFGNLILESEEFLVGDDSSQKTHPPSELEDTTTTSNLDENLSLSFDNKNNNDVCGDEVLSPNAYTPDFESDTDESSSTGTSRFSSESFECLEKSTPNASPKHKEEEVPPARIFSRLWDSKISPGKSVIKTPEIVPPVKTIKKSVSFHEERFPEIYLYPPMPKEERDLEDNKPFQRWSSITLDDWGFDDEIPEMAMDIQAPDDDDEYLSFRYRSLPLQPYAASNIYSLTGEFYLDDFGPEKCSSLPEPFLTFSTDNDPPEMEEKVHHAAIESFAEEQSKLLTEEAKTSIGMLNTEKGYDNTQHQENNNSHLLLDSCSSSDNSKDVSFEHISIKDVLDRPRSELASPNPSDSSWEQLDPPSNHTEVQTRETVESQTLSELGATKDNQSQSSNLVVASENPSDSSWEQLETSVTLLPVDSSFQELAKDSADSKETSIAEQQQTSTVQALSIDSISQSWENLEPTSVPIDIIASSALSTTTIDEKRIEIEAETKNIEVDDKLKAQDVIDTAKDKHQSKDN